MSAVGIFDFLRRRRGPKASPPPARGTPSLRRPSAGTGVPSSGSLRVLAQTSDRILVAPPSALLRLELHTDPPLEDDEALACLSALRASPYEGAGLEALLARHERHPFREPVMHAAAAALAGRGDTRRALTLLATAESPESCNVSVWASEPAVLYEPAM